MGCCFPLYKRCREHLWKNTLHSDACISEGSVSRSGIVWPTQARTLNFSPHSQVPSCTPDTRPCQFLRLPSFQSLPALVSCSPFNVGHSLGKGIASYCVLTCISLTLPDVTIFLYVYCFDDKKCPSNDRTLWWFRRGEFWAHPSPICPELLPNEDCVWWPLMCLHILCCSSSRVPKGILGLTDVAMVGVARRSCTVCNHVPLCLRFQTPPRWTTPCPPRLCCSRWATHTRTPTWARSATRTNSSRPAKSSTSMRPWRRSVRAFPLASLLLSVPSRSLAPQLFLPLFLFF